MSSQHEDCRSAWGGFSRCRGFQIVRAVFPTRRLQAPVGETSQRLNPGQRGPNVHVRKAKKKQPGAWPDCFQIPRGYAFTM